MAGKARATELVLVGGKRVQRRKASSRDWSKAKEREFLSVLADTCNVTRAAAEGLRPNRFSSEPRAPGPVAPLYPLIGRVGGWTDGPPVSFHSSLSTPPSSRQAIETLPVSFESAPYLAAFVLSS